ncbi:3-oxoacyl-[acyl-carrier-protein] reductase FabG-like [Antedon mediterranea]|uniref:3-oxoacyl-[acyl-carrier-protein] reductase FabG-like n=1 Tax=Antedon mediterranea TaxID=105859 RepID=UPI003AF41105
MTSLHGKVALVTGASSGIGAEVAKHFASYGCYLAITGRNSSALQKTAQVCQANGLPQDKVLCITADLTIEAEMKTVLEKTLKHFNSLDVLINNAGIVTPDSIETITLQNFDAVFSINVRAPFQLLQLASPHLIKAKGSVVNISSVTGKRAFPGLLSYCMSKSTIDHMTACASQELAIKGVRVNAVNPGVIITEVHKRGGMSDEMYAKFLEHCKETHAMGRPGTVDEVAKLVTFLASDESSYITGESIAIDGGRHVLMSSQQKV